TRLALYMAEDLVSLYPDGVYWVALAPVRDHQLVLNVIAATLGIRETEHQTVRDALFSAVGEQRILLVLDNCEQVQGLAPLLAELLAASHLQVLATSRKRLRLRGEQQIVLVPLALPQPDAES